MNMRISFGKVYTNDILNQSNYWFNGAKKIKSIGKLLNNQPLRLYYLDL